MNNISVIIPSNHEHRELMITVNAVCAQTLKPKEIVIVDSCDSQSSNADKIIEVCASLGISVIYERHAVALPGKARNRGVKISNSEFIAFVDVKTIPRPTWLEESLNLILSKSALGIWGATSFQAKEKFAILVRDGFFGTTPRLTLPGTVCKRVVFDHAGQFIDWVRAGEDTDWMIRVKLLRLHFILPTISLIDYIGLNGLNLRILLKKWYRNYSSSSELPHFLPQRVLLWLILYPLIVLISFNWNYLIADWRMDSILYIGHITKIALISPMIAYLIIRGAILPLKRGIRIRQLFPFRFIAIASICFIADATKFLVFSLPHWKFKINKFK